jgi:hypothetical protein
MNAIDQVVATNEVIKAIDAEYIEEVEENTPDMKSLPFKYRRYALFAYWLLESLTLGDSITPEIQAKITEAMHLMDDNIAEQYNFYEAFANSIKDTNKKMTDEKKAMKRAALKLEAKQARANSPDVLEKKAAKEAERAEKKAAKEAERAEKKAAKETERAEKKATKKADKKEEVAEEVVEEEVVEEEENVVVVNLPTELSEEEYIDEEEILKEMNSIESGDDDSDNESVDINSPISGVSAPSTKKVSTKEAEKSEAKAAKEAEKAAAKEAEKAAKAAAKEAEKAAKAAAKETEKAAKAAAKEAEREEKAASKKGKKTPDESNGEGSKKKLKIVVPKIPKNEE